VIRWHVGGYEVAFTTRVGGVSEGPYASLNLGRKSGDEVDRVDENRRIACESIGADVAKLALNYQVHSARVVQASPGMRGEHADRCGRTPLASRFSPCPRTACQSLWRGS